MKKSQIKHLAIIMDGNGRWAKEQGLKRVEGHKKGANIVRDIVTHARKLGIEVLTLYAFSEENWGRPKTEVSTLMSLLVDFMKSEKDTLLKNNIHFHPIGNLDKLPIFVKPLLKKLDKDTKNNAKMELNLALSYSGRSDLVNAVKNIINSNIDSKEITEETITKNLSTYNFGNDVDLLIRTGGDKRISNFLLWELSYSELFFEETYWPDFTAQKLDEILNDFYTRDRRFGLISE
jgi:undecaprenyl diphosphate synthase